MTECGRCGKDVIVMTLAPAEGPNSTWICKPCAVKQVIVIRKDLKMRRGKEIAQGAHAAMAFLSKKMLAGADLSEVELIWIQGKFTKVCLQVDSEKELLEVYEAAKNAKLTVELITDSGFTEFGGVPTKTCLAIGPDYQWAIDEVTSKLKLY